MRRKCRRMMAFTSDRLFIVRVDDGKAKASYPLKSVQLAPSDKVNQASVNASNAHLASVHRCIAWATCFTRVVFSSTFSGAVCFGVWVSKVHLWDTNIFLSRATW